MSKPVSADYPSTFLNPERPVLSAEEHHFIEAMSAGIIMHTRLQAARELIQRAAAENGALSEPRHVLVLGESGCGKSTLLDMFTEELPPKEEVFKLGMRAQQTALIFSLSSTITPRSMAIQILRALGDHSALNGTCQELTERLLLYIRQCNVQLIFMDEFQHLLALGRGSASGANKRLIEARNWIKTVINATHVTFVLLGMPDALALIDSEQQLERRFTHLFALNPFDPPSADRQEMVHFADTLLKRAVSSLPTVHSAEWFSHRPDDASRLYLASGGMPSVLKDLVIRAALIAYRAHASEITMTHFASAFVEVRQARLEMEAARIRREKRQTLASAMKGRVLNPFTARWDEVRPLILQVAA